MFTILITNSVFESAFEPLLHLTVSHFMCLKRTLMLFYSVHVSLPSGHIGHIQVISAPKFGTNSTYSEF